MNATQTAAAVPRVGDDRWRGHRRGVQRQTFMKLMILIMMGVLIYILRRTNIASCASPRRLFMEQNMSSQSTTRFPVEAFLRGFGGSGSSDQPVVLLAFARLVVIAGFLALFTPAWLDLSRELAGSSQAWGALRLVVLSGAAVWIAAAALAVKVWVGLLKFLARAD